MRQGIIKTIDGKDYEIWHLPALDSMNILTKIIKIILEPIGKGLGKDLGKNIKNEEEKSSFLDTEINIGEVFVSLSARLDENEIQEILKKVFEFVYKGNENNGFEKINLALDFKGEIVHMLNVFKNALEVNYSDFFSVIGDLIKKAPFIKTIVRTSEKQM